MKCVYSILNLVNGKRYIGSSVCFGTRKRQHLSYLRRHIHQNPILQSAWIKYGESAFVFMVLCVCQEKDDVIQYEQAWLDGYKPEYNLAQLAARPSSVPRSQEFKDRVSAKLKGRIFSTEHRLRISRARSGIPVSEEKKLKLSLINRGFGSPMFGRKHSDSTKEKMRLACRRGDDHWTRKDSRKTSGSRSHFSKLNEEKVREIRNLTITSSKEYDVIGERFGVCSDTIRLVMRGKIWKYA